MKNYYIKEERITKNEYIDFLKRSNLGTQYPKEDFEKRIDKLVKNASISLIARNEDGLIVGVLFAISDFAYWMFVTDLGVAVDYERLGIAKALMHKAHEIAGGERNIAIYLVANSEAIVFYEKIGMHKTDEVMEYNNVAWTSFKVE